MKLCFPTHMTAAILWILLCGSIQGSHSWPKRSRLSHVMRGFDILPRDMKLNDSCRSSFDCLLFISYSQCDWHTRTCVCQNHHVVYNNSMCLPASLLGYGCVLDSQCQLKVPNSRCGSNGLCECEENHLRLRKDKCLPPAKVDEFCLSDQQCHMADSYSYCKYIIPRIYGKCQCPYGYLVNEKGECLPYLGSHCVNHHDCELATPNSFCKKETNAAFCECREGFKITSNKMGCERIEEEVKVYDPVSVGKPCKNTAECRTRDPYSMCINGICDCVSNDTTCNAKNTGCHPDTFQCSSGYCISWYFVCDKQSNCPDNSDETECIPFNCPKQAFQCNDGTCLSRSLVCNGQWECPDGSDEARCYTGIPCDRNAFRCKNGQCLPQFSFCNAVQDCADGSDELPEMCEQGNSCPKHSFQCENSRCRSSAILCSGLDGCGDNSDETHCEACYCKKP